MRNVKGFSEKKINEGNLDIGYSNRIVNKPRNESLDNKKHLRDHGGHAGDHDNQTIVHIYFKKL